MAASLTLLQITSVDLIHLKARLFLERPSFNVDSSPGKADLSVHLRTSEFGPMRTLGKSRTANRQVQQRFEVAVLFPS
jgi:hypothetical protein